MSPTVIALIIIALIAIWAIAVYNRLVRMKNQVSEGWSDIDVQLKRRYDLIPNLVETVKGYTQHEQSTLQQVIEARNRAMSAEAKGNPAELLAAENALSSTLKSIFALAEAYPDLKANQNFLSLQDELADTENKIQAARRFYNGLVRDFNTALETIPTNLVASLLKYQPREFFGANEEERGAVKVKF